MKIMVTGSYATGSSAVYDYLKEFDNINVAFNRNEYEHALFYMPHGIFTLEETLFGNSGYISIDTAIRDFIKESENIYKYNYKFFGGYKKYIGKAFLDMTYEFVNEIATPFDARTIGKIKKMYFSPIKMAGQIVFAILKGYKIHNLGMAYKEEKAKGYILKASREEFIAAKQKYIARYLELASEGKKNVVFDHVVLPINVEHAKDFPEDAKMIIVERDPRDVYKNALVRCKSAKYGYEKPPYPYETATDFINSYISFRGDYVKHVNQPNVLVVRFEDMVLNYDETTKRINNFLCLDEKNHTNKYAFFNPKISAANICSFDKDDEGTKEIETKLKDYIYDFSSKNLEKIEKESNEIF